MKTCFFFAMAVLCSCSPDLPKQLIKATNNKRYGITVVDPPIVRDDIAAIQGNPTQWPGIILLSKTGEVYEDTNFKVQTSDDTTLRNSRLGLGPSFIFDIVPDTKKHLEKGSIKLTYNEGKLKVDAFYNKREDKFLSLITIEPRDFFGCQLSLEKGLTCAVKCSNEHKSTCEEVVAWNDASDPIIEMNTTSYPVLYAMTRNGKLLDIRRQGTTICPAVTLHSQIKFRPNKDGRYFLNANSDSACMQSENLDIYCDTNSDSLGLEKLNIRPGFGAEEIAFNARHTCLLFENGSVWCMGDNNCGQITGHHDGVQYFPEFHKIDFLNSPAKQIFTYAGGTCALLASERLQCFGLGASVLRKRLLSEGSYTHSFAWYHGFRPENICQGGAENGV